MNKETRVIPAAVPIILDGYITPYGVYADGRIVNLRTTRIMKTWLDRSSRLTCNIRRRVCDPIAIDVAYVVASTFIHNPDPEYLTIVNFKDGNSTNCDVSNLYWRSSHKGSKNTETPCNDLAWAICDDLQNLPEVSLKQISLWYNVSIKFVHDLCHNKGTFAHISEQFDFTERLKRCDRYWGSRR